MRTAAPLQAGTAKPALSGVSLSGRLLQRKCACGGSSGLSGECEECRKKKMQGIQTKLAIGEPGDAYEREANRIADQVMATPAGPAINGAPPLIQRFAGQPARQAEAAPASVDQVLASPGKPLEPALRQDMEQRFGYDFSQVRVHTGADAERSAREVNALAYTVGRNVVFGAGRFAPETREGQRLLAHELAHIVQQNAVSPSSAVVQRQYEAGVDPDVVAEREYGGSGAPKAKKCGRPSWCPAGFCDPYRSEKLAEYYRSKKALWLMAGISAAVNRRVVPLWSEYLWGGSSPKNLSADFGKDFTNSPTTKKTTSFLYDELRKSLAKTPPSVPLNSTISLDLASQIPEAIAELDDPASTNQMNFNVPRDIPGNLAGGIGKDQLACPSGAKPSPFNDERQASGKIMVTRLSASELTVTPIINYTVKDTIDLCPGDCGTKLESVATVPLSQFEATGISGDVPFTVNFAAPDLGQFTVPASLTTTPSSASSPKKP